MSIEAIIFEYLEQPIKRRYKGVPVGAFGLPAFSGYHEGTVANAVNKLKKCNYVTFSGSTMQITEEGKKYYATRKARM